MGDRGAQLGRPSLPAVGAVPLHGLSRRSARGRVREQLREARLERLEAVLAGREWLAGGTFSIADILMADVLRPVDMFDGLANYPPAAPMSRAPRLGRRSRKHTATRWRTSLRPMHGEDRRRSRGSVVNPGIAGHQLANAGENEWKAALRDRLTRSATRRYRPC